MSEPVSLADIKVHLRLDPSGTDEDEYLSGLITGARRAIELKICRAIVDASKTLILDAFPDGVIVLPGGICTGITGFSYFDPDNIAQNPDSSVYFSDFGDVPGRIAPVDTWPATQTRPDAVTIAYSVSALPADDLQVACQAIRLTVGTWYANREGAVTDQRGAPAEVPLSVTWLLESLISFGAR
jgi:uncharacterized phiE125 gp8 family phage protein